MSIPSDLRSRKRLATRQGISNVATRLFIERGFDHVTVDEIAAAADVGRMTVFNYFPRKEDMFFDLDEEGRSLYSKVVQIQWRPDHLLVFRGGLHDSSCMPLFLANSVAPWLLP